jgi:hypothetical protein
MGTRDIDRGVGPTPLERSVHWTLLGGLVAGGLLMAAGLASTLATDAPRPEGPPPPVGRLIASSARGDRVALLDLGLLVLMATPILRVAVLAIGWGAARDGRMLAVALTVLVLLGVSLWMGVG